MKWNVGKANSADKNLMKVNSGKQQQSQLMGTMNYRVGSTVLQRELVKKADQSALSETCPWSATGNTVSHLLASLQSVAAASGKRMRFS